MAGRRGKRVTSGEVERGNGVASDTDVSRIAALYHRVSTVGQADGFSMEYQREHTMAVVKRLGLVVGPGYDLDEVESGANPHRDKYAFLKKLVEEGKVGHVVVYRSDRVARDELVMVEFSRLCQARGVKLHFVDGTRVETDVDVAMQFLMGWHGRKGREETARQSMDGKERAARDNRIPNGTGAGLFGYDKDPVTGEITINEVEAEALRLAFDLRIGGASYGEICRELTARGFKSKTDGLLSPATVRAMVINEACTGEQWYGRDRYELVFEPGGPKRKVTPRPKDEWIRVRGYRPKIIEPAVFAAAAGVRAKKSRVGMEWEYELTEFSYCGECGSLVCGATLTANGSSRKYSYPYYRCQGTLGDHYRPKICDLGAIRADKLEPVVDEHIRRAVENPDGLLAVVRKEVSGGGAKLRRRIADLQKQLRKKGREADTLTFQRQHNHIGQGRYERLLAPVNAMLERLEEELALLVVQKAETENWDVLEEKVRAVFLAYKEGLSTLDKESRLRLSRLLNVRVTYFHGRVLVTGVLDPALFTTAQTSASPRERSRRCRWV